MNIEAENQAEVVINRSSTKDGGVGWSIRLIRRPDECDDDYMARSIAKHKALFHELIGGE